MKISPGLGTDLIYFGATEFEATKSLGIPDKTYLTESNSSRLQYHELRLELDFDPENDDRLRWMAIYNPDAELFGRKLIGHRENEVLHFLDHQLDETPTISDYGSQMCVHYSNHRLELAFQFGRLNCINIGLLEETSCQAELA